MKKWYICFIIPVFTACLQYSHLQRATLPAIGQQILKEDRLSFITTNGDHYSLQVISITPQEINGQGKRKVKDQGWESFSGSVPLDSLDLLIIPQKNVAGDLIIIGSGTALAWHYSKSLSGPDSPTLDLIESSGSSCPFIYSWTETGYVFEAEAFGTALGKALEIETASMLPALTTGKKELKVRITNERLETHYLNAISLSAVYHPENTRVFLDTGNRPWAISHLEKPRYAMDHSGRMISALIDTADGRYWESDLAATTFASPLTDSIELQFTRPAGCTQASLLVQAINTELITSVYQYILNFLGEDALRFLYLMENDPQIISLMQEWIKKSSLQVLYWDDNEWHPVVSISPEANAVAFNRLARLNLPESTGTTVRIKLRSLPDVWKLDAVNIDWTPSPPLAIQPVSLLTARGTSGKEYMESISAGDQNYAVLLPGEKIELAFSSSKVKNEEDVTYMIKVRGYLHEWLAHDGTNNTFSLVGNLMGSDRIEALTYLMQNERLLLPPIYADWKKRKQVSGGQ